MKLKTYKQQNSMEKKLLFTFEALETQYREILNHGYAVITCAEYVALKKKGLPEKTLVNRIDVDVSVKKAEQLGHICNNLGIKATFFIRLHAPDYNPFSFENYRVIKFLIQSGHEIGYHSEVLDQAAIWQENAAECLQRDLEIMNRIFGIRVNGVASHTGITGVNNLAFWNEMKPSDFGLLYEAYDRQPEFNLFQDALYISDSEWKNWKCYNKGKLIEGDRRSPSEHAKDGHSIIYLLIHSDTYYYIHSYEDEGWNPRLLYPMEY